MPGVAFTMKLKPGFEAEYRRRHDELWPGMARAPRDAGVSGHSISLDRETSTLFAVRKGAEGTTAEGPPVKAAVRRWWEYLRDIMETNPGASPVERPLVEVSRLD